MRANVHLRASFVTNPRVSRAPCVVMPNILPGGLGPPEVDAAIAAGGGPPLECDFVWRARRLVVETDGRAAHLSRRAFENDRRRDQRLMLAGWHGARFTWRQLEDEPATVVATLRGLVAAQTAAA
jgi:hypothetical protein